MPPSKVHAGRPEALRAIPPYTIEIEDLRDWLIDQDRPLGADRALARAMAAGVPAAWALFQDVLRPRLVGAIAPLCRDSREALAVADAASARLWRDRAVDSPGSPAALPLEVPLLAYCRVVACAEWMALRSAEDPNRPEPPPLDVAAMARALAGVAVDPPPPGYREFAELEARLAPSLDDGDLAVHLDQQRPGSRERANTARILNLPSVLALAFFALLAGTLLVIIQQPAENAELLALNRLAQAVEGARFDEAVRLLADEPPKGLEGLLPVRMETRVQRLREMRERAVETPKVSILSPVGKVDDPAPTILLRVALPVGPIEMRIVDAGKGTTLVQRTLRKEETRVEPGVEFARGGIYTIGLEWQGGGMRAQFEILNEAARQRVERRVGEVLALWPKREPALDCFLRAHVYRAEQCYLASLDQWRQLAKLVETSAYPRQEAALVLEVELRQPALALAELDRVP